MNHVTFDGVDLTTYGLYVSGDKTFNSPEKNIKKVSIPGRSGDLLIWDGTYKNVKLKYNSILIENFSQNAENLRNFLLSRDGYVKLSDDYHPNEYRLASYSGPLEFSPVRLAAGTATLEFNCRPERFLNSGETLFYVHEGNSIENPTMQPAYPYLLVASDNNNTTTIRCDCYRDADYIATYTMEVAPRSYSVMIDCETMDCWKLPDFLGDPKVYHNELITVGDTGYLKLLPGTNIFNLDPDNENNPNCMLTPRWYVL